MAQDTIKTRNQRLTTGGKVLLAAKLLIFFFLLVFINQIGAWLADLIAFQMWPRHEMMAIYLLLASAAAYALLLSVPFLPGIEIGLMLMAMLGRPGIGVVYLCTVFALSLSFLYGRLLPPRILGAGLNWFHLRRAAEMIAALEPLSREGRIAYLLEGTPSKMTPFLMRHRYFIIAVLFNIPGNAVIGGGGGIGLIAGMSRLFPFPKYLLLITVAILPVPIFFFLRAG